jgi:hypothetical protein
MSRYAQLLDSMMNAILAGDTESAGALLREKDGFPARAQLAVYAQGYRIRLREAIEGAYPALHYYLGKGAFELLAEGFIAQYPSRHFNLDRYVIGFGPYVAQACADVFACELAELESTIHLVYQAEETPALGVEWAQAQTPESFAAAPLGLRAASRLFAFDYPVEEYFAAFREEKKPATPAPRPNWLLVLRHKHQVKRLALGEAEYLLLSLLAEGHTLGEALDHPHLQPHLDEHSAVHLRDWMARWINEGVLREPS